MTLGRFETYTKGKYEFVCFGWDTSNAWGHEVHLLKNGYEFAKAKVRYYNRTWEAYKYQSAMCEAIDNYKKDLIDRCLESYKLCNGLKGYDKDNYEEYEKPFPRGVKAKVIKEWEESEEAKEIKELEQFVKEGK